jgi:hypothetical protein
MYWLLVSSLSCHRSINRRFWKSSGESDPGTGTRAFSRRTTWPSIGLRKSMKRGWPLSKKN